MCGAIPPAGTPATGVSTGLGAIEVRATTTTSTGATVNVIRSIGTGEYGIVPPTGRDETIVVDGQQRYFNAMGKDVSAEVIARGGAAIAPTVDPSGAPIDPARIGAATLAGGAPGSLAAVLQSLVASITAMVNALGGGAGVPIALPGMPGSPPNITPEMQAALAAGDAVAEATTADGRKLTLARNPAGEIRLLAPTGKPETVTLNGLGGTGERMSFDAQGRRTA